MKKYFCLFFILGLCLPAASRAEGFLNTDESFVLAKVFKVNNDIECYNKSNGAVAAVLSTGECSSGYIKRYKNDLYDESRQTNQMNARNNPGKTNACATGCKPCLDFTTGKCGPEPAGGCSALNDDENDYVWKNRRVDTRNGSSNVVVWESGCYPVGNCKTLMGSSFTSSTACMLMSGNSSTVDRQCVKSSSGSGYHCEWHK